MLPGRQRHVNEGVDHRSTGLFHRTRRVEVSQGFPVKAKGVVKTMLGRPNVETLERF